MPRAEARDTPADIKLSAPYVVSDHEKVEEHHAAEDKAEEILNDKLASDALTRKLKDLEEMFTKQQTLMSQVLARMGFQDNTKMPDLVEGVKPTPVVPLDAIISVYIPEGFNDIDREPIPVGVNGTIRWIPRGQYVHVTPAELEVLQNAVYEGEEFPVVNDVPLARKDSLEHFRTSRPLKYHRPRFPLLVQHPAA